ncbi:MAG: hypothetical protein RLZZ198_1015 [Bacteroidota bacterium]|jgi:hypothetical protein
MKPIIQLLFVCFLSNAFFCQHSRIEAIPKNTALKTQVIQHDTKIIVQVDSMKYKGHWKIVNDSTILVGNKKVLVNDIDQLIFAKHGRFLVGALLIIQGMISGVVALVNYTAGILFDLLSSNSSSYYSNSQIASIVSLFSFSSGGILIVSKKKLTSAEYKFKVELKK